MDLTQDVAWVILCNTFRTTGHSAKRTLMTRTARTRLRAIGWLCLVALPIGLHVGCAGEPEPQEAKLHKVADGQMTVVFIDQSRSAVDRTATRIAQGSGEAGSRDRSVLEDSLYSILGRRLNRAGDRVELFAINAKTLSRAFRVRHRNNAPRPEPRAFEDEQGLERIPLPAGCPAGGGASPTAYRAVLACDAA